MKNQPADFTWLLIWISKIVLGKGYNENEKIYPILQFRLIL